MRQLRAHKSAWYVALVVDGSAEGCTTLQPTMPVDTNANWNEECTDNAQRAWEAELRQWRNEAEERCEANIRDRAGSDCDTEARELDWDMGVSEIDAQIRGLVAELTTREVAMGKLAERFWTDGWRRLGFATESQYARERLGVSLSCIEAKRRLACSLRRLPPLEEAIEERQLGYEAARLVAGVASREHVGAWIQHATERTVKHLREDVDAAHMLARLTGEAAGKPPSAEVMAEIERVQSQIMSGQIFQEVSGQESRMSAPLSITDSPTAPLAEVRADAPQMSALSSLADRLLAQAQMFSRCPLRGRGRGRGRVTLRLRVTSETRRFYRWLERLHHRHATVRVPFLRFLCRTLIETWKHVLGSTVAYAHIYARDGYRCKSPVCSRHDVTPHHLLFRSAGGDDSDENVGSLCVRCHLEGVHVGRLTALPPASAIEWRIGREAHTIVYGRRRVRA